jgi:hypothetical protein
VNESDEIGQLRLFLDDGTVYTLLPLKTAARPKWEVSDHACRYCFGRVLVRTRRGKVIQARCAECAQHRFGTVEKLCCCGVEAGALGRALECVPNPQINVEAPQEIMVRERTVTHEHSP